MELFDAVDKFGNLLGFDLVRGQESLPDVYHMVVYVLVLSTNEEVFMTQRHPDKSHGGAWEITGGSVLKGETPIDGAVRELNEETGIQVAKEQLSFVSNFIFTDSLYYLYSTVVDKRNQTIRMQERETVAYRWIYKEEFLDIAKKQFPNFLMNQLLPILT